MPKMGRALIADSTAAMAGSLLGTSTTTSYIESAAGVSAGGRTGLTAIVVAMLFLLALFFAPLAGSVPAFATAPALLFVAVLMTSGLAEIDWDDITEAAPVVITALAMPFTYSIANGIAFGFISWTVIKLLSGRARELNSALVILSILFVIKLGFYRMSSTFDPASYTAQLEEKAARLRDLLAPFEAPEPQVFDSPREHLPPARRIPPVARRRQASLRDVRAGRQAHADPDRTTSPLPASASTQLMPRAQVAGRRARRSVTSCFRWIS